MNRIRSFLAGLVSDALVLLLPAMCLCAEPAAQGKTAFSVREYGAVGDGKSLDTAAINKAVEACASAGGGQVLLPPGKYLSGTVRLRSNVTLVIDAGAMLIGSTNLEHYQSLTLPHPQAGTRPPGAPPSNWHRALILGDGVEDVAVLGHGAIDGNKVFDPRGEEKMRGPHTIVFGQSRRVTVRDVSIRDSANYAILLERTDQVDVRDIKVTGGWDGVHFRHNRDVTIKGCQFFTGDDSVAGGFWENVLVTDCVLNSSCNCVRLIAPAKHLVIHDCLMYGPGVHEHRTSSRKNTLAGINLQPGAWMKTEGSLDDVQISDITMHNVSAPFHIVLKPGNTGGRITVSRVTATGVTLAASSVESWADAPIERVVFRDVTIECDGGGKREAGKPVEPPGVDVRPLPAWGFYARNVKDLVFDQVRLRCVKEDLRPVLMCDGVERLVLEGFRFSETSGGTEPAALNNVKQIKVRDSDLPARPVGKQPP